MHFKYHTEAVVLSSRNVGETNKVYKILTRELGLINATAVAVRVSTSKLNSSLVDYSFGNFTFIKSKNGWKITDAFTHSNLYFSLSCQSREKTLFFSRFLSLLLKLLPESQPDQLLFDAIRNDIYFLLQNNLSEDKLKNLECIVVLRLLNSLGYLGDHDPWKEFLFRRKIDPADLDIFNSWRQMAIKEINNSLRSSQLI